MLSGLLTLQSGTPGEDVPGYMNYFMGGANTIRGYGVTDLGEELSGKNQLLGTAEYSLTLIPLRRWDLWKISLRMGAELAVFADAGIAWTESRFHDPARPQRARGRPAPPCSRLGDGAARRGLEPRARLPLPLRQRDQAEGPARAVALRLTRRWPCIDRGWRGCPPKLSGRPGATRAAPCSRRTSRRTCRESPAKSDGHVQAPQGHRGAQEGDSASPMPTRSPPGARPVVGC